MILVPDLVPCPLHRACIILNVFLLLTGSFPLPFHFSVVKEIRRLNEREASLSTSLSGSWHEQYKDSAYVFVGGLPYEYSEGDIVVVMSQFGEVAGINLVRDKETGQSKGFAFIKYVDQRSTILAVDNMNGSKVNGDKRD
jgi:RNA-binding motif X-linked protein 2